MKANDDQCLTLVSLSRATYTDSHGQDASPLQVPSQQCWYSFAAETILRQIGVSEIVKMLQKRTMPGVGIEPTTP